MQTFAKGFRAILIAATLLGGIAACEQPSSLEEVGEDLDEVVEDIGDEVEELGDDIQDATSN